MHTDDLKESLKKLHANLETTGQVDEELEKLLRVLDSDIHQLLNKEERDAQEMQWLADRAQSLSAKFAAEHPRTETLLRDLGNILASMGI